MKSKACSRCGTEKPLTDFYKQQSNVDGYRGYCKSCVSKPTDPVKVYGAFSLLTDSKDVERFWSHVERGSRFECWNWKLACRKSGGTFWANGVSHSARRVAYALHNQRAPLESEKVVATCNNKKCVNPSHLYAEPISSFTDDGRKRCCNCRQTKPLSQFQKGVSNAGGLYNYCRPCATLKKKERDQRPGEKYAEKRRRMRRKFGIPVEEYDALLFRQAGLCAICGSTGGIKGLGVDHDHASGIVRSLLCSSCNAGIAMFKHDPVVMAAAMKYVRTWNASIAASLLESSLDALATSK